MTCRRDEKEIGKAFPSFGEGEIGKTARMSDEAAILGVVHDRRVLRAAGFDKPRENSA